MNNEQKGFFYFISRILVSALGFLDIYLLAVYDVQSTKGIILGLITFLALFILAIFLFIKSIDGLMDFEINRYSKFLSKLTPSHKNLPNDISIEQILTDNKFKLENEYYKKRFLHFCLANIIFMLKLLICCLITTPMLLSIESFLVWKSCVKKVETASYYF